MRPVDFPERNVIYAKSQSKYKQLPAFKEDSEMGQVVSCWKLSFIERVRLLFTGKLWVMLATFNKPLTPSFFTTKKSDIFMSEEEENEN